MIPTTDTLPPSHDPFPVAVILERRPAKSAWIEDVWQAVAITVGHQAATDRPISEQTIPNEIQISRAAMPAAARRPAPLARVGRGN